ncbi:hypothetical protein LMG28688_05722 [Paraburkholderia caffeinitolerans]|uniref:Uncharacterized protein n=1 Tax=Paraburkholderia caffeinitolerans TaxID=1723730 RepID=A0A6J5GLV0_9BURK|nr:hypothetical protein LMG28688_05722 [Paraburkholderia caffeinitolerans]
MNANAARALSDEQKEPNMTMPSNDIPVSAIAAAPRVAR